MNLKQLQDQFKSEQERLNYEHRVNLQRIRRRETFMKAWIIGIILLAGIAPYLYYLWLKK